MSDANHAAFYVERAPGMTGKPREKRKKPIKTTQLTLKEMRGRGYELVDVVEKRVPRCFVTKDLWGIADVVCVGGPADEIVAVQTTTSPNLAARRSKILDSDAIQVLRRVGIRFLLHAWRKRKGRYVLNEVDLS